MSADCVHQLRHERFGVAELQSAASTHRHPEMDGSRQEIAFACVVAAPGRGAIVQLFHRWRKQVCPGTVLVTPRQKSLSQGDVAHFAAGVQSRDVLPVVDRRS